MLNRKQGLAYNLIKYKTLFIMLIPAVIFFMIFAYLPMMGIIVAFKSYNFKDGIFFSSWSGFENFRFLFLSGKAWLVARNTVLYNLLFISTGMVASIAISIMLHEITSKWFKKFTQSVLLLPYFISWVVVAVFFYNIFNFEHGVLNSFLVLLGKDAVDIYADSGYWYFLLPIVNIWKGIGYSSIMYLAAMAGISVEYYEAAKIDGAKIHQRIWHITLPLLKPTIIILLILSIGSIMRGNFDMFYQLIGSNSMLYEGTDIIDTFVFRSLTSGSDFGMSSAAAFIQSVLCFVIISITNGIVRLVDKEYALY